MARLRREGPTTVGSGEPRSVDADGAVEEGLETSGSGSEGPHGSTATGVRVSIYIQIVASILKISDNK